MRKTIRDKNNKSYKDISSPQKHWNSPLYQHYINSLDLFYSNKFKQRSPRTFITSNVATAYDKNLFMLCRKPVFVHVFFVVVFFFVFFFLFFFFCNVIGLKMFTWVYDKSDFVNFCRVLHSELSNHIKMFYTVKLCMQIDHYI